MPQRSYLHPSQRTGSDQIGPSSHRNQYHAATLEGNWFEERTGFGPQSASTTSTNRGPFNATTTQRVSYNPYSTESMMEAKQLGACSVEAPRELLFYHGTKPVVSQLTVGELSYQAKPEGEALTYKEVLTIEGISPRQHKSAAKKSEAGSDDGASASGEEAVTVSEGGAYRLPAVGNAWTRDRFSTTKNVTTDATGEFLMENSDAYQGSLGAQCRGEFLKSLNASMHKTRLRN